MIAIEGTPAEPQFQRYPDLAAERLGGRALWASDEFFAPTENLLREGRARFDPARYTDHGKWMDGWETRRRRGIDGTRTSGFEEWLREEQDAGRLLDYFDVPEDGTFDPDPAPPDV